MINKYGNRVLCLLTAECAAYCRFCTRRRLVSDIERGRVDESHVDSWVRYLRDHSEVREVIVSGGDPFTVSDSLFAYTVEQISAVDSIKVIRNRQPARRSVTHAWYPAPSSTQSPRVEQPVRTWGSTSSTLRRSRGAP